MMVNVNVNTGQPIYELIAILEDEKKGYLHAAERIKDEVLSVLLEKFGYERGRYIAELRQLATRFNIRPSTDEFTLSLLHRTWMDMKTTFRSGQEAVIKACIKGEENSLMNYSKAIEKIPDNDEVKSVLENQAACIKKVLKRIKEYAAIPFK